MKKQTGNSLDRIPESPRPSIGIWFACIAPPMAALLHLQMSFALEHAACDTGTKIQLHVYTVLSLLVVALAGMIARRNWIALGSSDPGQHPGPIGTLRLLSLLGMIGAGIFTLFIIAQWFPNAVLPTCIRT